MASTATTVDNTDAPELIPGEKPRPAVPAPLPGGLEPSIYGFILKYSLKQQIMLLVLTLASFPFLYYSLDLPKTIINQAIGGKRFPQGLIGFQLDQIPYLMILCAAFLALVCINGAFKYYINTFKGQLGERMLRRFRYSLYQRLLCFPIGYFHKHSSAQIIPMITVECEQLGGFIGDAFVLPLFQGGQLLTIVLFMFMQDPLLGAAAIALYPIQGYVIPKLQRRTNQLGKTRVRTIRQVADRVQETSAGLLEVQADDTVKLQLTDFAHILGHIYDIRFEIYRRKFFTKFLNNFLGQLTPFFFYSLGGYLVIRGNLSFGALVAVLAAYKDMASPWKELLDFYQNSENSRITYEQIVEQFQPPGIADPQLLLAEPEVIEPLKGDLVAANLSLIEDDNISILDGITFTLSLNHHAAVIGQGGSGKNELAMILARLLRPTKGRVTIGGRDLAEMPVAVLGRRMGYVATTPYLFNGSLRDNLLLALRHRPVQPAKYEDAVARRRMRELDEARRSGNIDFDLYADWIDYDGAGVKDSAELSARVSEVLERLDFADDVYGFGLRWQLDPAGEPELAARLLEARKALAERLVAEGITNLVETYDLDRFNTNATVAENLLFGTPTGPVFDYETLAANNYVRQVLDKVGLTDDLTEAGRRVASTMVELFAGLPPEHEFFRQFSFISAEAIRDYIPILGDAENGGISALDDDERRMLLALPFKLIAARHRLDVIDDEMKRRLLEARHVFRADLPESLRDQIEFFEPEGYNAAASLQDNILFGKIAYSEGDAAARIPVVLGEVLSSLSLRDAVIDVGLNYQVGSGGSRLSLAQRQRAAIARAILKRPDLLILNEATSALDDSAQAKVSEGLRHEMAGLGLIWVLHRANMARDFDRILVMSGGKLEEQGPFAELEGKGSLSALLMAAE